MDILAALVVLVALGFITVVMVRGVGQFRSGTAAGLLASGSTNTFTALLSGLLVALAIAQLAMDGAGVLAAAPWATVGVAVGLLAALLTTTRGLGHVITWGFSLLGAVAAVPAIHQLVAGSGCPGIEVIPLAGRIATAALLVVFAATGAVFALAFGGLRPLSGLAWFGAVEVLAFLQTPGGVDLLHLGAAPLAVSLGAASVLGFLAARVPELVIGAAGASIALSQVALVDAGLGCGVPAGSGVLALSTVVVPFLLAFVAARMLFRRLQT